MKTLYNWRFDAMHERFEDLQGEVDIYYDSHTRKGYALIWFEGKVTKMDLTKKELDHLRIFLRFIKHKPW